MSTKTCLGRHPSLPDTDYPGSAVAVYKGMRATSAIGVWMCILNYVFTIHIHLLIHCPCDRKTKTTLVLTPDVFNTPRPYVRRMASTAEPIYL